MQEPHSPRPFATSRYGSLSDHVEWQTAIEHYHWDRVTEAHAMALALGVGANASYGGWYRLIEAEAITRERATIVRLAPWLELEFIRSETEQVPDLAAQVVAACDAIAHRFGWEHGPATRVAILANEADAPWAIGRYGYMADKHPYDKICIPEGCIWNAESLRATVAHEYAHVIVLNGAEGKAPTWLDEGIAMLAEPSLDPSIKNAFASGRADWLSPDELDFAFHAERRNGENSRRVYLAYQQAAWIGRYLTSCCGERAVTRLLEGFRNNTPWGELKMRLTGQHPADEALREVFNLSETEVFAAAKAALRH